MTDIIRICSSMDCWSWLFILGLIVLLIILIIFRTKPFVQDIVRNAVIETEELLNSESGQDKLIFATEIVKSKLPFIFKIFITKRTIVTLIEKTLNTLSISFKLNKIVDIKGNDDVPIKLNVGQDDKHTNFNVIVGEKKQTDSDTNIYGCVKTTTDWHDETNTSIEIGFKKKI